MSKLPTDREILERIYAEYAAEFRSHSLENPTRDNVMYVPIDVKELARRLDTHPQELFGRLYYHLDHKYRYKQDNGANVQLFAFSVGKYRHCVHFPYLSAILADKRTEHHRNLWSIWLSLGSLVIAVAAIWAQLSGNSA